MSESRGTSSINHSNIIKVDRLDRNQEKKMHQEIQNISENTRVNKVALSFENLDFNFKTKLPRNNV